VLPLGRSADDDGVAALLPAVRLIVGGVARVAGLDFATVSNLLPFALLASLFWWCPRWFSLDCVALLAPAGPCWPSADASAFLPPMKMWFWAV
jgi:hypothetical protein